MSFLNLGLLFLQVPPLRDFPAIHAQSEIPITSNILRRALTSSSKASKQFAEQRIFAGRSGLSADVDGRNRWNPSPKYGIFQLFWCSNKVDVWSQTGSSGDSFQCFMIPHLLPSAFWTKSLDTCCKLLQPQKKDERNTSCSTTKRCCYL